MAKGPYYLIFSLSLAWFIHLLMIPPYLADSSGYGFTIDLIHHDSPKLPSYDPSSTLLDRHRQAFLRSASCKENIRRRRNPPSHWASSLKGTHSGLSQAGGEYYMEIAIGTPPISTLLNADTGSDLIWTQCKPCIQCYPQSLPIFDPKQSSTYQLVPCPSDTCKQLGGTGSCSPSRKCVYKYGYEDDSVTKGDVATETITLVLNSGSPISIPSVTIGCGHNNSGTFDPGSGIVGLGVSPLSLISHMENLIQGKFSYCLVPFTNPNATSKLNFGEEAIVSGQGVVSTPLLTKPHDPYYYTILESISIGTRKVVPKVSSANGSYSVGQDVGNIIIDSGTTYNYIHKDIYEPFESALLKVIQAPRVNVPDMGLCFKTRGDLDAPPVILHFKGADVILKPKNIFARMTEEANIFTQIMEDTVCLTIIHTTDLAILGSYGMADFHVGFDLRARTVSFKPTDCTISG